MKSLLMTIIFLASLLSSAQPLEIISEELNRLSQGEVQRGVSYDLKDSNGNALDAKFVIVRTNEEYFNVGIITTGDELRSNLFLDIDNDIENERGGIVLTTSGTRTMPFQKSVKVQLFFNTDGRLEWVKATRAQFPKVELEFKKKMFL